MPNYLLRLSFFLILKTIEILIVVAYAGIGLGPDEAQYWTWSRHLDFGYYSKPPGIAWQIWLGTQGLGQTEIGVRVFSLFWGIGQSYLVYAMALFSGFDKRTAFWSGILMALTPLGVAGSFFAITDGGALFFWTLACCATLFALGKKQEPSPLLVGFCIAAGALFKWPVYIFWVFFLIGRFFWFPTLSLKRSLKGVLLSLTGLLPSVWWNYQHEWATFRHVFATMQGGHGNQGGNPLEFLGAQMLLVSPLLFLLLLLSFRPFIRKNKELAPPLLFCGLVTFSFLTMAAVLSFFQKIQGNWAVFAYPTAFVWLAWFCLEKYEKWMKAALGLSVCLVCLFFSLPALTRSSFPFKHNVGWEGFDLVLKEAGYHPSTSYLLGDKYQTVSLLSFYGPGQKLAYFLNLNGSRQNQFSYWPPFTEESKERNGFFVILENPDFDPSLKVAELQKYFEVVNFKGVWELAKGQRKRAYIFECAQCKEKELPRSFIY